MRLKNKKIIVTAAAQGIGRATAITFANEGAEVIALDINKEKLDEISKENSNIKTKVVDATNKSEVENFCSTVKSVDVLFHAVVFGHQGHIMACDSVEFY